jgi:hypothetical protein
MGSEDDGLSVNREGAAYVRSGGKGFHKGRGSTA